MPAADVYRSLWRHRWLIVLFTALAGAGAYFLVSSQPKVYEASALIRIQQRITSANDAFGSLELGKRLAQTYAQIVKTNTIKDDVKAKLPALAWQDINISSEALGDVELLRVMARHESPETAARVVNAATLALKEFVADTGTLRDQIIVVDRAGPPDTAVAPRPMTTTALVIVLALLLNGALALLIDFLSDRLPSVDEIEEKLKKPLLATVPQLSLKQRQPSPQDRRVDVDGALDLAPASTPSLAALSGRASSDIVASALSGTEPLARRGRPTEVRTRRGLVDLTDSSAEPFRALRLSIDLRPETRHSNVIVFTSTQAGEGKSTIAANYAVTSAANERHVLLVDADFRSPVQHEIFAVPRVPGMTELVGSVPAVTDVVHRIHGFGRLDLLTAGSAVPRPGDLTGSRFMHDLLRSAAETYDLVVVDTPPVLATSDGAHIAAGVGGDLVFVVSSSQRMRPVSRALKKLDLVGVNVLGLVLNREGRLADYGYAAA